MQHFRNSQSLPASAADVMAAVCNEEYLHYRYDDGEALELQIEVLRDDAERYDARITRVYGGERIPAAARRLLKGRVELIQTQSWLRQGPDYSGSMRLEVRGVPGHIEGEMQLVDTQAGHSELSAQGGIEVRVPLLGKQIEKMLVDRAEEGFGKSMRAIVGWLERD